MCVYIISRLKKYPARSFSTNFRNVKNCNTHVIISTYKDTISRQSFKSNVFVHSHLINIKLFIKAGGVDYRHFHLMKKYYMG